MKKHDKMYYKVLRNHHTGYARVTCLEILAHLYVTYIDSTDNDWDTNNLRMKTRMTYSNQLEYYLTKSMKTSNTQPVHLTQMSNF